MPGLVDNRYRGADAHGNLAVLKISLSLSLSLTHTHTLSLSHTHTYTHTQTHAHKHTHSKCLVWSTPGIVGPTRMATSLSSRTPQRARCHPHLSQIDFFHSLDFSIPLICTTIRRIRASAMKIRGPEKIGLILTATSRSSRMPRRARCRPHPNQPRIKSTFSIAVSIRPI